MIEPDLQSLLDIRLLCIPKDRQAIDEIDIQNFGQYQKNTIDNIKRKNKTDYQRIYNSIAHQCIQETMKNHNQSETMLKLLYHIFLSPKIVFV